MTEHARAAAGHRLLPHTADVIVSAWAPTREECLSEAVLGLVASFADVSAALADCAVVSLACDARPDSELLVWLLEEVIYLADTREVVPVNAVVTSIDGGGIAVALEVAPLVAVDVIRSAQKAVARHGLLFEGRSRLAVRGGHRCLSAQRREDRPPAPRKREESRFRSRCASWAIARVICVCRGPVDIR